MPLFGSVTFHDLAAVIAGIFAIITILLSLFLIVRHATHFSKPAEQKQYVHENSISLLNLTDYQTSIIRVISLVIFFSVISWLAVWFEDAARFLTPLLPFYESYIFASFFLLLCAWISPNPLERDGFFNNLEHKNRQGEIIRGGSLALFHVRDCAPPLIGSLTDYHS